MIKIIKPRVEFLDGLEPESVAGMMRLLERAARTCYKTEEKAGPGTADKLIKNILSRKPFPHESVIEHRVITVKFVCDRSASHQLVRHRLAAYSQESQRYCNYNKSGNLEVICPPTILAAEELFEDWLLHVESQYLFYQKMVAAKIPPEDARSVLPNCTKTEVVTTYNLRQWRHFLRIRTDSHAQWQIRGLALMILEEFRAKVPVIFDDVGPEEITRVEF